MGVMGKVMRVERVVKVWVGGGVECLRLVVAESRLQAVP